MFTIVSALFAGCSSDDSGEFPPPSPELAISSENASVTVDADGQGAAVAAGAEGLSVTLGIATNLEAWTLSEEIPSWIEVARTETSLTLTVGKNESVQVRNASLTVSVANKSGKLDADIRIAQSGVAPATLELSDKNPVLPPAGGSVSVTVTSNQAVIDVQKIEEWLSFTQSEGKITFTAEANDTEAPRTADVTITAGTGENTISDKIVISQDVHITLVLSEKNLAIPAAGGSVAATYTTNQSTIDVQKTDEWLSFTKAEGSITFTADANTTGTARSAEVNVAAGTGENAAVEKVTVSQAPLLKTLTYVVKTTADGKEVALPTLSSGDETVSISVDYGDGSAIENFSASLATSQKHTYTGAGEYTVTITTDNVISAISFAGNTSLSKIGNNSLDMSGVTTLSKCFYNCIGLTEIAFNTLMPCINATNAENLFYGCKALTAVPAGIFTGLTKITSFNNLFQNCSALTSVPAGLFEGYSKIKAFNSIFYNTAITEIPARCFAGCTAVTEFKYTFNSCNNLKTIALDVFEGCTAVSEMYATFTDCKELTEVPAGLFAKMPGLNYLEYTFQNCSSLPSLPASLFDNCRSLRSMDYCFQGCTSLTGESPYTMIGENKVHLYEREYYPDSFLAPSSFGGCFAGDEGLSDYTMLMQTNWAN